MPRTIIYASKQAPSLTYAAGIAATQGTQVDDYSSRLQKYVPAEVLSFFLIANALPEVTSTLRWIFLAVALLGTPLYLYARAPKGQPSKAPQIYFYPLACIAFLAWALGTSPDTARLWGLTKVEGPAALICVSFLIPAIDKALDDYLDRRRRKTSSTSQLAVRD